MRLFLITSLLLCVWILPLQAFELEATDDIPSAIASKTCALQFDNASIQSLIDFMSDMTGKTFLYDEAELKGKITIRTPTKLTLDEAYQLFLTVLSTKGLRAVEDGSFVKIEKDVSSGLLSAPDNISHGSYLTRVLEIQHLRASELLDSAIKPLLSKQMTAVSYEPTNQLILTGPGKQLERIIQIIRRLDVPSASGNIYVIPVKHAAAKSLAKLCTEVLQKKSETSSTSTHSRGRSAYTASTSKKSAIVYADAASNSLIAFVTPTELKTLKLLLSKLDVTPSATRTTLNVYHLKNADAETLTKTLSKLLTKSVVTKGVSVTADTTTNTLLVDATSAQYRYIKKVIQELDIAQKQVAVEALILELSMDATEALGAALKGGFETSNDGLVYASTQPSVVQKPTDMLSTIISGLLVGGFFNPITYVDATGAEATVPALSALINLSKTSSDVNIMSAPRLLTSDNQEAEIIVGENVPIVTNRLTDTGSDGLAQSVSVERKDVALTLKITPQVVDDNKVRLSVYQEITDLSNNQVGNVDEVGPTFKKRLIRNTVLAEDGQTIILGGLISKTSQTVVNKTPFLGDLPGLGWLFKTESNNSKKTNILILITPKILSSREEADALTASSQLAMKEFDKTGKHVPIAAEVILDHHMHPKYTNFRKSFQKHQLLAQRHELVLTRRADREMKTLYLEPNSTTTVTELEQPEILCLSADSTKTSKDTILTADPSAKSADATAPASGLILDPVTEANH